MASFHINHIELGLKQIRSVNLFISIVKRHSYRTCQTKKEAMQIIDFMRNCYLIEHPFDELDFCDDILTPSEKVANILTLKHCNNISQFIEVTINWDNMIALSKTNYQHFFSDKMMQCLSTNQRQLLTAKTNAVIKKHSALMLERKEVEKVISQYFVEKPRPESVDLSTVDKSLIISEKAKGSRSKTHKKICQLSLDGEVLAVYPNAMSASQLTGTAKNMMYEVLRGKRKTTNGFIWRYAE